MNDSWTLYNPNSGSKIRDYQFSDFQKVLKSLSELDAGFKTWRKTSLTDRQKQLLEMIKYLEADQDHLAQMITDEMGKSIEQSRAEVKKCIDSTRYLCQMDLSFLKSLRVKSPTYSESEVSHEPMGILLSILPWNYPAWQGFRAFIPNLLAGNTILLKHSEISPTAGDLIASYFAKAGFAHLLQHHLFNHDHTETLIKDSRVGGVSITGSVKAGQTMAKLCSQSFKKCVLELGGSDPAVILPDSDLEKSCASISRSRLQNAGQVCISAKRAVISRTQKDKILTEFKKSFVEILQNKIQLVGALAHARFKDDYNKIVSELKKHSELVYEFDMASRNSNDHTAFVNPCILYFDKNHEILKTTEVFGPCLVVIGTETAESAIEIANSTIFGLGASVFGNDLDECKKVASELLAGQISINDFVKSDARLPFGGVKMSGMGREVGIAGFYEFTQTKVISVKQ